MWKLSEATFVPLSNVINLSKLSTIALVVVTVAVCCVACEQREVGHFLVRLQTWSFEHWPKKCFLSKPRIPLRSMAWQCYGRNAFEERFHIFHSAVTEVKDAP